MDRAVLVGSVLGRPGSLLPGSSRLVRQSLFASGFCLSPAPPADPSTLRSAALSSRFSTGGAPASMDGIQVPGDLTPANQMTAAKPRTAPHPALAFVPTPVLLDPLSTCQNQYCGIVHEQSSCPRSG